jgi:hypothetical protein
MAALPVRGAPLSAADLTGKLKLQLITMTAAKENAPMARRHSIVLWNRSPRSECADSGYVSVAESDQLLYQSRLARDGANLFSKRLTFFALVDYKCVVFTVC